MSLPIISNIHTFVAKLIRKYLSVILFFVVVLSCIPALADDAPCNPGIAETPAEWKQHFPFDLIFPDSGSLPPSTSPASDCPTITFWGTERPVCSIKTITAIVKNVFLFNVIIKGLFQL